VNWHIPEADGVNVWPNVSSTLDELGSQDGGQMSAMSGGRYSGGDVLRSWAAACCDNQLRTRWHACTAGTVARTIQLFALSAAS